MARSKKDYTDEEEDMAYTSVEPGGGRPPKKNPAEWLITDAKVDGFARSYNPQTLEALADEVFNEARLREVLCAYPVGRGDIDVYPLYIDALAELGFSFSLSVTGEMCMFVNRILSKSGFNPSLDDDDDYEGEGYEDEETDEDEE